MTNTAHRVYLAAVITGDDRDADERVLPRVFKTLEGGRYGLDAWAEDNGRPSPAWQVAHGGDGLVADVTEDTDPEVVFLRVWAVPVTDDEA